MTIKTLREKEQSSKYTLGNIFIMARDNQGRLYAFGTNEKMLGGGDAERFKHCDLSRYPVGAMVGYDNQVEVIETSQPVGVDEAIRVRHPELFTAGPYISTVTKKQVVCKVRASL